MAIQVKIHSITQDHTILSVYDGDVCVISEKNFGAGLNENEIKAKVAFELEKYERGKVLKELEVSYGAPGKIHELFYMDPLSRHLKVDSKQEAAIKLAHELDEKYNG